MSEERAMCDITEAARSALTVAQCIQSDVDEILGQTEGEEPKRPGWIETDGYRVDAATGECLGPVDMPDGTAAGERFRPTDLQGAAWVLRKRGKAARRLADLVAAKEAEVREEEARIEREFRACIDRAKAQLAWWEQYDGDLQGVLEGELVDSRARSIIVGAWRMGYRRLPGRIDITDEHLALAWAREHLPEAIVVKESVAKKPLKGHEGELPDDAFEVVEPTDRFYIDAV